MGAITKVLIFCAWACALGDARAAGAQQETPREFQPGGRTAEYVESLFGVPGLVDVSLGAAIDQWQDDPAAWNQDLEGFGQRLASNAGRNAVGETVQHGLAALLDRSVSYQRCTCSGVPARTWHAFLETITDRGRDGERWPALPRVAGSLAGAYAASLWEPGDDDVADVRRIATKSVLFWTLGSLWKEFVDWP